MSKRILFATLGTQGDVHPYIAIGRKLRANGHRATIATLARHAPAIRDAGLEFAEAQPDARAGSPEDPLVRVFVQPSDAMRVLARELVLDNLEVSYATSARLVDGHDLTVLHPTALGARLAAEKLGRPWLSSVLSPVTLPSRLAPPRRILPPALQGAGNEARAARAEELSVPWTALRQRLGLREIPVRAALDGPLGYLALFSRHFAPDPGDWPQPMHVTGFCRYDGTADAAELVRLSAFVAAGPPPLVATLGGHSTLIGGRFFTGVQAAARRAGLRLVAIGGTAEELGLENGPDLACFPAMPFSQAFRHAAVVLAHAGIGTTAQVLAAGVPFLAVALPFHDGPDNVRRVRDLGIGFGGVLQGRDLTGLLSRIPELVHSPRYSARARRLAAAISAEDGAAAAARRILQCA